MPHLNDLPISAYTIDEAAFVQRRRFRRLINEPAVRPGVVAADAAEAGIRPECLARIWDPAELSDQEQAVVERAWWAILEPYYARPDWGQWRARAAASRDLGWDALLTVVEDEAVRLLVSS